MSGVEITVFRGPVFSDLFWCFYLQRWVAPKRLWCRTFFKILYLSILLRWASSEHASSTVGCVVSVESVRVDPAEADLAAICTYSLGYFGLLFSSVVEAWILTQNQPEASDHLEIFPERRWDHITQPTSSIIKQQQRCRFCELCMFLDNSFACLQTSRHWNCACSTNKGCFVFCSCTGSVFSVVRAAWQETSMSGCKDKLCTDRNIPLRFGCLVTYIEETGLKQIKSDFAPLHCGCTLKVKKKQHLSEIWLGAHLK